MDGAGVASPFSHIPTMHPRVSVRGGLLALMLSLKGERSKVVVGGLEKLMTNLVTFPFSV